MKYKIIVFDIDGTITRHVSSWRYIHEKLGLWDVLAKKYQEQFLAGKISYKRFCELDAAHWKGIKEKKLHEVFKKVRYSRNAKRSVKKLKKFGFKIVAISTGLQFAAERIKNEMDFDHVISNRLNIRNGVLTGSATINISYGAKGKTVRSLLKLFSIKPHEMIAVGDSEGDIPMIKIAGYSIAFNSSSDLLSSIVDFNCKSDDFMDVCDRIIEVSGDK